MMRFFVLGPLHLESGARSATLTARKQRQLVSLFLLNAGVPLSVSDLVSGLWDNTPPPSAHASLQSYVTRLRKQLAICLGADMGTAKQLLVTTDHGYLLNVSEHYFDLHEYRGHARGGENLLASGAVGEAFESTRKALAHWRGQVLADVQPSRVLAAGISRLEESRLRTVEHHLDAALRLGRHQEHLEELSDLCVSHPLHENFHVANMVALYRYGLRADALRIFCKLRRDTVDHLGLEPPVAVQRLQQAILHSNDDLSGVHLDARFGVARSVTEGKFELKPA